MLGLSEQVDKWISEVTVAPPNAEGMLTRVVGLTLEASGISAPIGSRCDIESKDGKVIRAEVVGFSEDKLLLMPFEKPRGAAPGQRVVVKANGANYGFSEDMLGRVIDGLGAPLDDLGPINPTEYRSLSAEPINPLSRRAITEPLDVGVRAINALLTVGRGQRLGLMAGSGVGKSVLLGMMTRYTKADVIVIGLIGERGREVQEFVKDTLGPDGMRRAVVIAAPSDTSPVARIHGANLATAVAEFFRDKGKQVLLLVDSLTRVAHAQREVGLAVGEPPATKGYPPSVFTLLPSLIERAGNAHHSTGSITAFYTVLAEGDDQQDPIIDSSRAILDGHLVLTRELAAQGHFPAIDILQSVSRLMPQLVSKGHYEAAIDLRRTYSAYEQNKDLISVGAYQRGTDPDVDQALRQLPFIKDFLRQDMRSSVDIAESIRQLQSLPEEFDDRPSKSFPLDRSRDEEVLDG